MTSGWPQYFMRILPPEEVERELPEEDLDEEVRTHEKVGGPSNDRPPTLQAVML